MDFPFYENFLNTIKEIMNNSEIEKVKDSAGVYQIANTIATVFEPYQMISEKIKANLESYIPAFEMMEERYIQYRVVSKLGENQYVIRVLLPPDLIEEIKDTEDSDVIDKAIENYIETEENVSETINLISQEIGSNLFFNQGINAFHRQDYNLAILGFISVLDRLLADGSDIIDRVIISDRVKSIEKKVDEKGDFFVDDLDAKDYILLLSYAKAFEQFGKRILFSEEEPEEINRNWLMHGRSNRICTRMDCIKILNMIYGTLRMTKLGSEDNHGNETI